MFSASKLKNQPLAAAKPRLAGPTLHGWVKAPGARGLMRRSDTAMRYGGAWACRLGLSGFTTLPRVWLWVRDVAFCSRAQQA